MTNKEAIEALYTVRAYYASLTAGYPKGKDCRGIGDVMCSEIANSCLMAIKALEQEDVLDKIRAEMDDLASHKIHPISFDQAVAVDMCINIIDKYKAESGGK